MELTQEEWEILADFHDEVMDHVLSLCPYPKMDLEELKEQKGRRCQGCSFSKICDVADKVTDVLFSEKYEVYFLESMNKREV